MRLWCELLREQSGLVYAVDAELCDTTLRTFVGEQAVGTLDVGDAHGLDASPAYGVGAEAMVEHSSPLRAVNSQAERIDNVGVLRRIAGRFEGELDLP
jgi:hypothetical protein